MSPGSDLPGGKHCRQAEARGECWLRELKGRQRGGNPGAARADLGPSKQATGLRVDHLEPDRDSAVPCAQQESGWDNYDARSSRGSPAWNGSGATTPPTSIPEPRCAPSTGPTSVQNSGPAPKILVP